MGRKANVNRYVENLKAAGTSYVLPARHNDFDWLAFPLMHKDRKGVLRFLESNEVQIWVCFAGNITRHPAYRHYLKEFPGADEIMADAFLIGAHRGLTFADVDRVCDLLIEYDKKKGKVQVAQTAQVSTEKERDSVSLDF